MDGTTSKVTKPKQKAVAEPVPNTLPQMFMLIWATAA
jgi:hypothetical protein